MTPRVTYGVFNLLLLPFYPLLLAYTFWRRYGQKKSAESFAGHWGAVPASVRDALRSDKNARVIWIHAVSVGEQMAAGPIARALKNELPKSKILLTATTDTGFAVAQKTVHSGAADAAWYLPLDLPVTVERGLRSIRPDTFLAVETELWPNFLHLATRRGLLCFLVNGRVSDNLLKNAKRTGWLWRWMLANLNGTLMRSQFDAERMREIATSVGADEALSHIEVCGDVKLDGLLEPAELQELRSKWRKELHIADIDLLWVCGSTHPGEEEMLLCVFQKVRVNHPHLKLLIAPRHLERTAEVAALVQDGKFKLTKRSQGKTVGAPVILLDTIGELADVYAAADVAFVGGSLIPRGGHNVLEPVLRGVPVLFGPHMANFRAAADLVKEARLGEQVADEEQLQSRLESWLQNESGRQELPDRVESFLTPHQHAPERIARHIARSLSQQVKSTQH